MNQDKFKKNLKVIIITGLSGAGKTEAVRSLEDLGFFCVDNIPPNLIPKFVELLAGLENYEMSNIALVMDVRGRPFFGTFFESLQYLDEERYNYEILYLEASDKALVRRFKETRRKHPLFERGSILEGISQERKVLQDIRGVADKIIDTSDLMPIQFKKQIEALYGEAKSSYLIVSVMSFGFKYGLPLDADIVMDVRFLSNPHYEEDLRSLTGEDYKILDYVMRFPETRSFLGKFSKLLLFLLPFYVREGKTHLAVAIGCTGGKHRSVALVGKISEILKNEGYRVSVKHRDIRK